MPDWTYISENIKLHEGFDDNMRSCLYAAEKHGIVTGQAIEDSQSLIDTARKYLPPYTITDTVNADCVIIKQAVIDLFGLPDINGADIPAALAEYYEKISSYGFSAVTANHALYSYKTKTGAAAANDPLFRFLPVLDEKNYCKKRILFECMNLPCAYNGSTEAALSAFEAFCRLHSGKYDIYMLTNREAAGFFGLNDKYNILYEDTIAGVFHLGFSPVQMMWYEPQLLLDRHCLKIAWQVLDIIMLRSGRHFIDNIRPNIELALNICDGIAFISGFSKDDFIAYFNCKETTVKDSTTINIAGKDIKCKVIPITKEITDTVNDEYKLPFKEYYLVAGSGFKHKAINETAEILADTKHNYITLGADRAGYICGNIYNYQNGNLDEELINTLFAKSKAVIFPSLYEGFGLPALTGLLYGKYVILYDNAVNREMQSRYPEYENRFLFYKSFDEIPKIINNDGFRGVRARPAATVRSFPGGSTVNYESINDSWDAVAAQLGAFFEEMLNEKTDAENLRNRRHLFRQIEARSGEALTLPLINTIEEQKRIISKVDAQRMDLQNKFGDYKLLPLLRLAIAENLKHRHTKLYNWLKRL